MLDNLTQKVSWAIKTIQGDPNLDKGITDVDLAKILGTNKNTLAAYRRGEGLLKGEVIDRLVSHYHFNPMWLFKGEGEPFPGARAKYEEVCGPEPPACQPIVGHPDFPADDFVLIRQMNGRISAGRGLMPDNSADMAAAFRKDYIKRKGGKPESMSLIKVSGDSMEPTLLDGDLVLVNHSRNTIAPQGGIYAISINDEIMIKRVQRVYPDKLLIISDNKNHPPFEMAAENVRVNGKVIWYARDLER